MSRAKLVKLIDKLNNIESVILIEANKIIGKNKGDLEEYNVKQLEFFGIDSENKEIQYVKDRTSPVDGPYTIAYSKYKRSLGKKTNHVDLRLTGAFHKSIELRQDNPTTWIMTSTDDKYTFLVGMYGDKILGVVEEFLDEFSHNTLQPNLQEQVSKKLSS